jgi:hypothetical protein
MDVGRLGKGQAFCNGLEFDERRFLGVGMVASRLWDDTRCDYFVWLVGSFLLTVCQTNEGVSGVSCIRIQSMYYVNVRTYELFTQLAWCGVNGDETRGEQWKEVIQNFRACFCLFRS